MESFHKTNLRTSHFDFATAVIGHVRGGLAQVNVLASMVFAGVSGAAVADCAGLGIVEIKAMSERGYKRSFAAAITAASSAVGPIIPPSIPLVIYAYIAGTSVGRMFLGGMLPGIIIGLSLMATNYILSYKYDFPRVERAPFSKIARSALDGVVALIAPIIIIGSILTGVVTATAGHFRHHGFIDRAICPVIKDAKVVGPAVTVKTPGADSTVVHKVMEIAEPGDVIVVDRKGFGHAGGWKNFADKLRAGNSLPSISRANAIISESEKTG